MANHSKMYVQNSIGTLCALHDAPCGSEGRHGCAEFRPHRRSPSFPPSDTTAGGFSPVFITNRLT